MFAEKEDTSFEDANLYYVAMTRARKELTLTSAPEGTRDVIVGFIDYPSMKKQLLIEQPEVEVKIKLVESDGSTILRDQRIAEFLKKSLQEKKGIDFTKFSTFFKDKQKFYEKYVLGLVEDTTSAIAYGNMVHSAIEEASKLG